MTLKMESNIYIKENSTLPENYCGTSYAAKFLGLSVGTIQALVEKNELIAWRTEGGHRRILMQSIFDFQKKHEIAIKNYNTPIDSRLRILLVEDDDVTREIVRSICESAAIPIDCTTMSSGMEALIDITSIQPHVLITDLNMPGIDGFELLRILRLNPQFENMTIIALSALTSDEIQARGGLPEGSIHIPKPPKADWFNGFFAGAMLNTTKKQNPS